MDSRSFEVETNSYDKRARDLTQENNGDFQDAMEKDLCIEEMFASTQVPPWCQQITLRGIVVSAILGGLFCIIIHKLGLTSGMVPALNLAAGLLGFFLVKTWTKLLQRFGWPAKPFTRQENTVIQTCVVACYGIASSGGFSDYILAMDEKTRLQTGPDLPGNGPSDVKNPQLGWLIAFIFTVSFLGLLSVVPLRKIMIIDHKLTYPSGTATGVIINSFHTPRGQERAQMQVKSLGKYFAISFVWSFFKWLYSGDGECGFDNFPILGLQAQAQGFYTDFSLTYVGVGMICPHLVNISLLLGGIISWGLMWPLIRKREGDWYPTGLKSNDLKGLSGYKAFIATSIILADGLYNVVKLFCVTMRSLYYKHKKEKNSPLTSADSRTAFNPGSAHEILSAGEQRCNEIFVNGGIPFWVAAAGYVVLAAISLGVIPLIFSPVKWYHVLVAYIVAPFLGFCNAYGAGLTDCSMASLYSQLGIFIFAAWAGNDGGVICGLALCGVMMVIVSTGSDLMQDFKTGHLTLSSPRSMFASQIVGTLMGCVLAPLTFWMFWSAFDIGNCKEYPAPAAAISRQMALIGVEGFSVLPKHCLQLCCGFFLFAVLTNLARDMLPNRLSRCIPIPIVMAIPFFIGPFFGIDMVAGSIIVFIWRKVEKRDAELLVPAVASGLICGDGGWTVISAILAAAKVNPPVCMSFSSTNSQKLPSL